MGGLVGASPFPEIDSGTKIYFCCFQANPVELGFFLFQDPTRLAIAPFAGGFCFKVYFLSVLLLGW
jgi:hypothetical protein